MSDLLSFRAGDYPTALPYCSLMISKARPIERSRPAK